MAITRLGLNDPEQAPKPVGFITAVLLASLAAAVGALALFTWIAEEMLEGETARFDMHVRMWVHGLATPELTSAMKLITTLGSQGLLIALAIAVFVFWRLQWKRAIGWLVISLVGCQPAEGGTEVWISKTASSAVFRTGTDQLQFPQRAFAFPPLASMEFWPA